MGNINILAQKNTYVNFFSAELETPLSLVTKELTVITGVFQKLENIWEAIPRINRNKAYVCNQLQELSKRIQKESSDMSSRLNLLMRVFSISGKDLSDLMSIDSSLVSKWRSGKRMLKPTSAYADKIVAYIIERDAPNHYKKYLPVVEEQL